MIQQRFKKQRLINEKVAEGLKRNDPKTLKFYLPPKTHKQRKTGRPVVSSVNTHTVNISNHIDFYLQSIVKGIPSTLKTHKLFSKS